MAQAITFRLGSLLVQIEGEPVAKITRWAAGVYAPLKQPGSPQLVFRFVEKLPSPAADAVGDGDVQVARNEMRLRERRFDVRISGRDPMIVELCPRKRQPLFLRSLADPEETFKMWLSHGASLDMHLLKEFAYTIAPLALQVALLRQQASLIHAGAIAMGERAVLLPAWGGVGKSTVVSRAVLHGQAKFLADDHAILDAEGRAHLYLLPMHIYHYHMKNDALLRQRVLASCSPLNRLQWRLTALLRPKRVVRWVAPQDIFGKDNLARSARIEQVILMFRGIAPDFLWQELSPIDAARICAGVLFEEVNAMPQRLALAGAGWSKTVLPSLGEAHQATLQTYEAAFSHARCAQLLVPREARSDALIAFLRQHSPLLNEAMR